MTWVKGQSGNPKGKSRWNAKISRTITEIAREMAPRALQTLDKVMRDPKSSSTARAIAADRILDRAYGKAPQAVGVVLAAQRKASELSDDELAAIVAGALPQEKYDDTKLIEGVAIEEEAEQPT